MMLISSLLIAFLPLFGQQTGPADLSGLVKDTMKYGKPELISKQFNFTEGPAADREGNVFFTDQPNNRIWKYSKDNQLTVFMEDAGRSNGLYFDEKDNLIACADEHDQLWSISPDKKVTVLVKDFQGKRLNGPNDVWVAPGGGIYFTDPYYQRDYWTRTKPDIESQDVYYLAPGASAPVIVADDLQKPNGIIGSPDGKELFVADIEAGKIFKFQIAPDGKLDNKQFFVNHVTDGMTLDEDGNLYLAGKGVAIYNPEGDKIGQIQIPEPWTANLCFGGKNRDQLFIAASRAFYRVQMEVKGAQ